MRLSHIAAVDLLSFAELSLDVPDGLSVIVGSNGSGKTNLGRLVRLAGAAVRAAASGDFATLEQEWSLAGRYGSPRFEARVEITFDREGELALIEDWARAAFLTAFQLQNAQTLARLDGLLPDSLRAGDLLARGQLIVRRDDRRSQPWGVCWQTIDPIARLDLGHGHTLTGTSGPVFDEAGRVSSRKRPHEALRTPDGTPVPDLTAQVTPPNWEEPYAQALASFAFADLCNSGNPVELVARRSHNDPELPSLRRLMAHFPAFRETVQGYLHFAQVLDYLISSSLVVTDNRRVPVTTIIEPVEINALQSMEDGSGLAIELLRLKTGDAADRTRFRAVQDVFQEITDQRLDIRQQASGPEAHELLLTPVVVDTHPVTGRDVDLSLRLAGAGVEESAWLATLLTGDHHALVLDEPASNVSAIAQRRVLQVLRKHRRGRQTIMITHSADLVPVNDASDLAVITRLTRQRSVTKIHQPRLDQHQFDELKELLRHSQLRALLFAAGVVLVEGPTEVDAFETWLAGVDELGLPTPESSHVVFLSVGGDERFAKHSQLMEALGIPYAIVADGPAFAPGKALTKLPHPAPAPADPTNEAFVEAVSRWAPYRVRTLATEFGTGDRKGYGEIEAFFETVDASAWAELSLGAGRKDKPLLGFRFANRTAVPARVVELWKLLRRDLGLTAG
ncbi:TOPRIM nucleotidyl transferase/hydrolase domain-containing protein [Micromonospora sp. PTRAS2]